jgi:serine protease Do
MSIRNLIRLGIAGALATGLLATPATARSTPDGFADLAERLSPAVVNISTVQAARGPQGQAPGGRGPEVPQFPPGSPFEEFFREFFDRQQRGDRNQPNQPNQGPQQRRPTSLGSGFIIDPTGYVVTNNHVIDGADEITVTLADDTKLTAKLIGRDAPTDLALLKVEPRRPLPFVPWGDSDRARVGDWVVAIGNPFGLGGSVTAGILSARSRDIQTGRYDDFLQTDASINRGNSGGPLFNLQGEVIGINTAIYSPTGGSVGIGFAIPATLAKPVVEQLRQFGKARRGWLGVRLSTVTDEIADAAGLKEPRGGFVGSVMDGSPAQKAQIRNGDIIIEFDGREVANSRRLQRMAADTPADKAVDVVVWRRGERVKLRLVTGEFPEDQQVASATPGQTPSPRGSAAPSASIATIGMQIAALTPQLRQRFGIADDVTGVVVTEVRQGSDAADKGIRSGDVIREVNQEEVRTPQDVTKRIETARAEGKRSVLLILDRKGDPTFAGVRIDRD